MNLTPKQQRFIEEYLIDLNATQAARRAGYSEKTARNIACENLAKPDIQEAIAQAMAKRAERTQVTADRVVEEFAKIGFANSCDFFDWGPDGITVKGKADLTPEQQAAVAEVSQTTTKDGGTVKIKLHDKRGALDSLARHLGMFKDNLNVGLTVRYEDALKELK